MKKTTRPEKLRILGRDFKIAYETNASLLGECEADRQQITIRDGQVPIEEADTLVHESFHAIWYLMDIGQTSDMEEHVVRKLATGFTLLLKENPELLKYLSKS